MIYLILSILCSSSIFLIFKYFQIFKVKNFEAIVINYLCAGLIGIIHNRELMTLEPLLNSEWTANGIFLGIVFISLFNVMALTAQRNGASVAAIANKMALVIPVCFAIIYYNDSVTVLKAVGIILALIGVYLSSVKSNTTKLSKSLLLPLILFLGSGFIDTFLNYTQVNDLKTESDSKLFTALTFLTAFLAGTLVLLVKRQIHKIQLKSILAGIILGLINYGSIYFIIQCLALSGLESSVVFPINNVSVVLVTSAIAIALFKEQLSFKNKIGVIVSVLAIIFISIH